MLYMTPWTTSDRRALRGLDIGTCDAPVPSVRVKAMPDGTFGLCGRRMFRWQAPSVTFATAREAVDKALRRLGGGAVLDSRLYRWDADDLGKRWAA